MQDPPKINASRTRRAQRALQSGEHGATSPKYYENEAVSTSNFGNNSSDMVET
jgi:hypothetical protein